jgi:hypothetical protein
MGDSIEKMLINGDVSTDFYRKKKFNLILDIDSGKITDTVSPVGLRDPTWVQETQARCDQSLLHYPRLF